MVPFLNNPKDLDPSYKTDLDFLDCLGRKKTLITEEKQYSANPAGNVITMSVSVNCKKNKDKN